MDTKALEFYTENDYYNLPENIRAELIDGQFYDMAAPSRIHQEILSSLHLEIGNYLRRKGGTCEVFPAPFAVFPFADETKYLEPDISVICDKHLGLIPRRGSFKTSYFASFPPFSPK